MATAAQLIIARDREFLEFLHSRYHLIHASNVFFRDLHYGVMTFLERQKLEQGYVEAEATTREVIAHFETTGVLQALDERTWMVTHEEFRLPQKKAAAPPAKPAAAAPAPAVA